MKNLSLPVLALLCLLPLSAGAQTPTAVLYNGLLYDNGQPAPDGAYTMEFAVFDAVTSGNQLATTGPVAVGVASGEFVFDVGALFVDGGPAAYLEVSITPLDGGDPETLPRTHVAAQAFAVRASIADRAEAVDWADVANAPALLQGDPGPAGPTGPEGATGADGAGVTALDDGASPQCPNGGVRLFTSSGEFLVCHGDAGPQGVAGAAGATGAQGLPGAAGSMGPVGATGPQGAAGSIGPQGVPGAVGATGPQGPQGTQGPAGSIGPQGLPGAVGATGPQGPQGTQGPAGSIGPQGLPGAVGATGPQGAQGAQGSQGPAGSVGATGAQGAAGQGVPVGGSAGQVLAKINGTNFNTQWVSPSSGVTVRDGNGVTLGALLDFNDSSFTILTSTGHRLSIDLDGSGVSRQAYMVGGSCGGTPYVNSGTSSASRPLTGKAAYYYPGFGWGVPTDVGADGSAPSQVPATYGITIGSIYNTSGTCSASTSTQYMWRLGSISQTALGLPATIATPITAQ